jgi:hypothetical protein
MEARKTLPNAVAVLVLGICSIIMGCLFVGLILGIIGLSLSGRGRRLYHDHPDEYEGFGMLNAGYIMSLIGVILGGLYMVYFVIVTILFGGAALSIFNMAR